MLLYSPQYLYYVCQSLIPFYDVYGSGNISQEYDVLSIESII